MFANMFLKLSTYDIYRSTYRSALAGSGLLILIVIQLTAWHVLERAWLDLVSVWPIKCYCSVFFSRIILCIYFHCINAKCIQ